jgi:hypothetical protein
MSPPGIWLFAKSRITVHSLEGKCPPQQQRIAAINSHRRIGSAICCKSSTNGRIYPPASALDPLPPAQKSPSADNRQLQQNVGVDAEVIGQRHHRRARRPLPAPRVAPHGLMIQPARSEASR